MRLPTLCLLIAGLLLLLSCSQHAAAANTYTVQVGFQALVDVNGLPAWYGEFFYPVNLTIVYGDSVTFVFATYEVHNVVFSNNNLSLSEMNAEDTAFAPPAGELGPPSVFSDPTDVYDSGIRTVGAPNYTLTFTPPAGSYLYYCTIHKPAMAAYINVLPLGDTAPLDPDAAWAEAQAQIAYDVSQAEAVQTQLNAAAAVATGSDVAHSRLADGSILWSVQGGAMTMFPSTVYGVPMYMRFLPTYLEVHEGDTVQWTMDGNGMGPHTVVFEPDNSYVFVYGNYTTGTIFSLADDPYLTTRLSPLVIGFNTTTDEPIFDLAVRTETVPNAALVDSGLIFPVDEDTGVPYPTAFRVQFTSLGTYNYSCSLHETMGMTAQVVVKPLGSALCTIPNVASSCDSNTQTTGGVLGDPTIIGLRSQKFQVHGLDGAVYSLVTHPRLQLNGRFSFLASGSCPADRSILCWSHPGSYISSVGLMLRGTDGSVSRLEIHSGAAASGLQSVQLNGRVLAASQTVQTGRGSDLLSVHRVDSHHVLVRTELLTLHIDSSDGFLNHRIEPRVALDSLSPMHGIIGQTWQDRRYKNSQIPEMEGQVDDYLVQENDLFGTQFPFNQW